MCQKTDIYKRGDNLFVIFNAVQNPCLVKGGKGNQQLFTAQKTSAFYAHSCKHCKSATTRRQSLQLQAETEITEEDVCMISATTTREFNIYIEALWVQNSESFPSFPSSISERNWKNGSVSTKQNCSLQACIWQAVSLLTSFGYSLFGEAWQENRRTVQTPKQSGTKFSGSQRVTHTKAENSSKQTQTRRREHQNVRRLPSP